MQEQVEQLLQQAETDITASDNMVDLEQARVRYLGKKGELTALFQSLGRLPPSEKPAFGQVINQAKQKIQEWLQLQERVLEAEALSAHLQKTAVDVTLPGRRDAVGAIHPVTQVMWRIEELFSALGFSVMQGPEVEDEYHNFEALNIPASHPARAEQDTFYLGPDRLLRTQTSPVQIRSIKEHGVPIRMIAPGRVYRRDSDQTHTPMFHQVEGLCIEKECTFSHLKWVLKTFLTRFFEKEVTLRFRPGYFPFTEPSAEVDMIFGDDWLEILGCGMVHPAVLDNLGIDSSVWHGFAFGLGVDRLAMLRFGVSDIRLLFENDVRFLEQFAERE